MTAKNKADKKKSRKSQARVERAHGGLDKARERFHRAQEKLRRAEARVEKALHAAAAEVENRVMYAADAANESTSSEVNLLSAATALVRPPRTPANNSRKRVSSTRAAARVAGASPAAKPAIKRAAKPAAKRASSPSRGRPKKAS